MTETPMLTAAQAAQLLGLSARKLYALAAAGEIAAYRFGAAVRFDPADLNAYKAKCRSPATTQAAGSTSLIVSSMGGEHALTAYFRKARRGHRRKTSTAGRQRDSSTLQLVASNPSR
jgi:excisionase family DNA binding protein